MDKTELQKGQSAFQAFTASC